MASRAPQFLPHRVRPARTDTPPSSRLPGPKPAQVQVVRTDEDRLT